MSNRKLVSIIIPLILLLCACAKKGIYSKATDNFMHGLESSTTTTIDYNYRSPIDLAKYQGIYLPVSYINNLKETHSHNKALSQFSSEASFLDVRKDHIESDSHYHDSFWIKREQIEKYDFSKANEGIIIDENSNQYIKIGEPSEKRYDVIRAYIHSILFKGDKKYNSNKKEFIINADGSIEMEGKKYYLKLDIVFGPLDIDVYQTKEGQVTGIRTDSEKIEVIKLEDNKEEFGYKDSREVVDTYYVEKNI